MHPSDQSTLTLAELNLARTIHRRWLLGMFLGAFFIAAVWIAAYSMNSTLFPPYGLYLLGFNAPDLLAGCMTIIWLIFIRVGTGKMSRILKEDALGYLEVSAALARKIHEAGYVKTSLFGGELKPAAQQ